MAKKFIPNRKNIWGLRGSPGVSLYITQSGRYLARQAVRKAKKVGKPDWKYSENGWFDWNEAIFRFEKDYTVGGKRPRSAIIAHHPSSKGKLEGRRAIKRAVNEQRKLRAEEKKVGG